MDLDAWQKASAELGFPLERPLRRPGLPGIAGEWRGPSQFFNGKIAPVVPYAKTLKTIATQLGAAAK